MKNKGNKYLRVVVVVVVDGVDCKAAVVAAKVVEVVVVVSSGTVAKVVGSGKATKYCFLVFFFQICIQAIGITKNKTRSYA
jgi:hypothetical protein